MAAVSFCGVATSGIPETTIGRQMTAARSR
jgi:hypothetical protein